MPAATSSAIPGEIATSTSASDSSSAVSQPGSARYGDSTHLANRCDQVLGLDHGVTIDLGSGLIVTHAFKGDRSRRSERGARVDQVIAHAGHSGSEGGRHLLAGFR